jgi:DNA-directed RNA polymerase II subunit RPB1
LIRFEVNSEKMRSRHMSMDKIEKRIRESLGTDGVDLDIVRHSDAQTLQQMVFRLRISGVEEGDEEESVAMRLREAEQMILNELALKGKKQITKFTCAEQTMQSEDQIMEDSTGAFKGKQGYFYIDTDGVELKSVMIEEKVDHTIITSNSVREVLTVLGVEAARLSIMKELRKVLARYDIYVNYRHLSTLCDIMTNKGTLTAITRHGINRIDSGVLRKASFEETVEILLEGAVHGELDRLTGVTENIIMG